LNQKRQGKKSICFGVTELDKIKLKKENDFLVNSFDEMPNTIVVGNYLDAY